MNGIRGGGGGGGGLWWKLLTDPEIRLIEKECNPNGLSFSPPISWPEAVLARNLAIAYSRHDPRGIAPNPLPDIQLATEHLTKELNRILNKRREEQRTPQLAAWIRQGYYAYTHEEVWNPAAVVASSDFAGKPATNGSGVVATGSVRTTTSEVHMAGSSSFQQQRPVRKESYQNSEISTLQSGGSTTSASVGAGIRPTLAGTPPTTTESESSLSPKRVAARGRATTRPHRQGPEPTGSCPLKRLRVAHACPHCTKTFPFPSKLKDHMHIHAETKGYACGMDLCTKAFKRRRELQAHRKTHGEISPGGGSGGGGGGNRDVDDEDEEMNMGDGNNQSPADPEPPDGSPRIGIPLRTDGPPKLPIPEEAPRVEKKPALPLDKAPHRGGGIPITLPSSEITRTSSGSSALPPGHQPSAPKYVYQQLPVENRPPVRVDRSSLGMQTTLLQTTPERCVSQELRDDDGSDGEGMSKGEALKHMERLATNLVTGS